MYNLNIDLLQELLERMSELERTFSNLRNENTELKNMIAVLKSTSNLNNINPNLN